MRVYYDMCVHIGLGVWVPVEWLKTTELCSLMRWGGHQNAEVTVQYIKSLQEHLFHDL